MIFLYSSKNYTHQLFDGCNSYYVLLLGLNLMVCTEIQPDLQQTQTQNFYSQTRQILIASGLWWMIERMCSGSSLNLPSSTTGNSRGDSIVATILSTAWSKLSVYPCELHIIRTRVSKVFNNN